MLYYSFCSIAEDFLLNFVQYSKLKTELLTYTNSEKHYEIFEIACFKYF